MEMFDKSRTKALEMFDDMVNFLVLKYNQSRDVFSYATSFGQLALVMNNIYQMLLFFIQDSINELNVFKAQRVQSIRGLAGISGHKPASARGAIGEISLSINQTAISDIQGDYIILVNQSRLRCVDNNLIYLVNLSDTDIAININSNNKTNIRIGEGKTDFQTFQGDGNDMQTFQVNLPSGSFIDEQNIEVTLNGEVVEQFNSLYDMLYGSLGCLIKVTGDGNYAIVFGNKDIHRVPKFGEEVRIDYTTCAGTSGNLLFSETSMFTFVDTGFDINGNEIDLNKHFNISVSEPPVLASNPEPPELTRLLTGLVSRNYIVHDRFSLEYFLKRLNYFSILKVYKTLNQTEITNELSVLAIPKIKDRMTDSENYFSVDTDKFLLLPFEKNRILNMLDESGRKSTNLVVNFMDPTLKRYVAVIMVDAFELKNGKATTKQKLKESIKTVLDNYLLSNVRIDKIPHSDIVKIIDNIDFIDSVKVGFISMENELQKGVNIGFDELGNISTKINEYALIRGGFSDRNGIYYQDEFDVLSDKPCSVNIQIKFIKE